MQPVRVLKTERDIPVETLTLVSEFDKVTVKVYDLEFRRVTAKLYAFAYLIEVAMGVLIGEMLRGLSCFNVLGMFLNI